MRSFFASARKPATLLLKAGFEAAVELEFALWGSFWGACTLTAYICAEPGRCRGNRRLSIPHPGEAVAIGASPERDQRKQLYVGGQSSRGHLAAVALTTDWPRDFGLPPDMIKGGMCISGMYDLMPVRLSARSNYVEFDDTTVVALSPIRHLDRLHVPVAVAYGACETPEFQRQNREFTVAVKATGVSSAVWGMNSLLTLARAYQDSERAGGALSPAR